MLATGTPAAAARLAGVTVNTSRGWARLGLVEAVTLPRGTRRFSYLLSLADLTAKKLTATPVATPGGLAGRSEVKALAEVGRRLWEERRRRGGRAR
jgi:hypothetical protein